VGGGPGAGGAAWERREPETWAKVSAWLAGRGVTVVRIQGGGPASTGAKRLRALRLEAAHPPPPREREALEPLADRADVGLAQAQPVTARSMARVGGEMHPGERPHLAAGGQVAVQESAGEPHRAQR
jgi:hypothetical protein